MRSFRSTNWLVYVLIDLRDRKRCSTCSGRGNNSRRIGWQSSEVMVERDKAPVGQTETQCPQLIQFFSASFKGMGVWWSSFKTMICAGQFSTQMPSRLHFVTSTVNRLMYKFLNGLFYTLIIKVHLNLTCHFAILSTH